MPFLDALLAVVTYTIAVNLAGFLAFLWDKYCAMTGRWRVRETTLLAFAVFGGTIGCIVGQQVLRHKTTKEPFRTQLLAILIFQVAVLIALCFPQVRNAVWSFGRQLLG
jgi:uncharacterized membrane protein YsdA (DUF1294 family)